MWKSIPGLVSDHYKQGNLNWPMIIYISLVHGLALAGLWHTQYASKETLMFAFFLWIIRYVHCLLLLLLFLPCVDCRDENDFKLNIISNIFCFLLQWFWDHSGSTSFMESPIVRSPFCIPTLFDAVQLHCQSRQFVSLVP